MRCLYCGKELALFKRLRGGEFCSDAHRLKYQEEYTQLALNRLMHSNAAKEQEDEAVRVPLANELPPAKADAPAPEKRDLETVPVIPISTQLPVPEPQVAAVGSTAQVETAVLEPVPEPEPEQHADVEEQLDDSEPAPAGISTFLVELPVPVAVKPGMQNGVAQVAIEQPPVLPRFEELAAAADQRDFELAGRITLRLFDATDFRTPLRERGLELREFVRGVPPVEITVKLASGSIPKADNEPEEIAFAEIPPGETASLWSAPETGFGSLAA